MVTIVRVHGRWFVEVDNECLEFNRLDMFRIKIKVDSKRNFESMVVNDGLRDYMLVVPPLVYKRDLK